MILSYVNYVLCVLSAQKSREYKSTVFPLKRKQILKTMCSLSKCDKASKT